MAVTVNGTSWNVSQGDGYRSAGGPSSDVRAFQTALREAGFDPGSIDGIYGPKTQAAYQDYLASQGESADGGPTSAAEDREYINIPGQPEIWKHSDGSYRIVYYVPDTDPPIPVTYTATEKEVQAIFGPDNKIEVDRTVSDNDLKTSGALNFGTRTELANLSGDPIAAVEAELEKQRRVRPWLEDEGVVAVILEATLENRQPTEAEFQATDWWQNHNELQRDYLLTSMADPMTIKQRTEDYRLQVRSTMEAAGINNPPQELVNWMADEWVMGNWSEIDVTTQISALSDPHSDYEVDGNLAKFVKDSGLSIDTTQAQVDVVRDLAQEWLGPKYGALSDDEIQRWAGRLRNDVDAEQALVEHLRNRRLAIFQNYENPNLTYEDIASGWRAEYEDMLGGLPDETDSLFIDAMKGNDTTKARQTFHEHGIRTKNEKVLSDLQSQLASFTGPTRNYTDV